MRKNEIYIYITSKGIIFNKYDIYEKSILIFVVLKINFTLDFNVIKMIQFSYTPGRYFVCKLRFFKLIKNNLLYSCSAPDSSVFTVQSY